MKLENLICQIKYRFLDVIQFHLPYQDLGPVFINVAHYESITKVMIAHKGSENYS